MVHGCAGTKDHAFRVAKQPIKIRNYKRTKRIYWTGRDGDGPVSSSGEGFNVRVNLWDHAFVVQCPVRVKVAKSGLRLQVILRGPDSGCVSSPGPGRLLTRIACWHGGLGQAQGSPGQAAR